MVTDGTTFNIEKKGRGWVKVYKYIFSGKQNFSQKDPVDFDLRLAVVRNVYHG